MITVGQLVVIETTRVPHGDCVALTLGSQEGLAESGVDRLWHVMLTQHDLVTPCPMKWPSTRSLPRRRFVTVLEVYLKPWARSVVC